MAKVIQVIADPGLTLHLIIERKSDGKFWNSSSEEWQDASVEVPLTETADYSDSYSEYSTTTDPDAPCFWKALDDSNIFYDRNEYSGAGSSQASATTWAPSLADVKVALRIDSDNTIRDAALNAIRVQGKDIVERICRRSFDTAERTYYINGSGDHELQIPDYPITAVSSIHIDGSIPRDWSSADLLSADYYMFDVAIDDEEQFLILRIDGGTFPVGIKNTRVIATTGYSTIPGDLYRGTIELIMWLYEQDENHRIGMTSKSQEGGSAGYAVAELERGMPTQIRQKLEVYRSFITDIQWGGF